MISRSRRDSVGGVVAEFIRGLQEPTRLSGGGVVAEFIRGLQEPTRLSGGGVVAEFIRDLKRHFWQHVLQCHLILWVVSALFKNLNSCFLFVSMLNRLLCKQLSV